MEIRDSNMTAAMEEDSDWEYEYSNETETHLITLDLSLPEFVRRRDDLVVHNTRGGFRSWANPLNLGSSNNKLPKGLKGLGDDDGDGDNDGDLAEDSDDEHNNAQTGTNTNGNANGQSEEPDPTEIQILELHAAEPIIAYRGMLFKGAWHETIGTEMLFADKSEDSEGIPVSPEIDLVGAASARISCTHAEVRPRGDAAQKAKANRAAVDGRSGGLGFIIPVGNAASRPRQQQASFLEQLMVLKHQHGEPDVVTVQALETRQNAVRGDAEEAKRRARRETLLQVHQERRAKRLRDAEAAAGGEGSPTTTPRRARRSRLRKELSPLATVAGDDELMGAVTGKENDENNNGDDNEGAQEDAESISEGGNDSGG
ncbi:hypothetical protein SEUCBS140593_009782 [Sporothrix eucalyptigena]|uniref:Transcription factor TFIIIC triple barrel domain-containing protein n=1 Tax=Sporothrix eucalyptigena TaxID=1812306 RepID=A0ABP0CXP7_9PEZI